MTNSSVVQKWLAKKCTWKMQTVLLTSFRGCDGAYKNDPGKVFTRAMRATILKNADPTSTFFPHELEGGTALENETIRTFLNDMDHYPVHWFMHLVHAAEICAYKCPNKDLATFWWNFYCCAVHELHLIIETETQLNDRLRDKI